MIIDVRTKAEFDEGHAEGAVNIDVADIVAGAHPQCPLDEHIILYCRSGARASGARSYLLEQGFQNVENLGGLGDMIEKGYHLSQ
jgi:rhodanese-related sulfurtransferase